MLSLFASTLTLKISLFLAGGAFLSIDERFFVGIEGC